MALINQVRLIDTKGQELIALTKGQFRSNKYSVLEKDWYNNIHTYFTQHPTKKSMIMGVELADVTGLPEMRIISPVYDDQTHQGFIVINLNWHVMTYPLTHHIYHQTGYAFIFNESGTIISHPHYKFMDHKKISSENFGNLWQLIETDMKQNQEQTVTYHVNNQASGLFFKPMKLTHQNYAIAATSPLSEFFKHTSLIQPMIKQKWIIPMIIIACVIILFIFMGLIMGYYKWQSIHKDLSTITQFVKKISQGELFETLSLERSNDIGELANALNQMLNEHSQMIKLSNLKNLFVPIFEVDHEFSITYMNDAASQILDMPVNQCIGKKCYDLMSTDACKTNQCACFRSMTEKVPICIETYASIGNQKKIPIVYTGIPIRYHDESIGAIIHIVNQSNMYDAINAASQVNTELMNLSASLENTFQWMNSSTRELSTISEQTNNILKLIAESKESISENINKESSVIEQMTNSLAEVSESTKQAKTISHEAQEKSSKINERMNLLAAASEQIEKIITVIDEIADRTDLLALNAAIEAEGAGSAGKGFAVVANEVQKLARQSSDATTQITKEISDMQKSVQETIHTIEDVNQTINKINTINHDISEAVAHQKKTSIDIFKMVHRTSQQAITIADHANEFSSSLISLVQLAKETDLQAEQSHNASEKLSQIADTLSLIGKKIK